MTDLPSVEKQMGSLDISVWTVMSTVLPTGFGTLIVGLNIMPMFVYLSSYLYSAFNLNFTNINFRYRYIVHTYGRAYYGIEIVTDSVLQLRTDINIFL